MKILHLTLKKKWFDMIASGEKKEEYREIKHFWEVRLGMSELIEHHERYEFTHVCFTNGYQKDAPRIIVEYKGISIGKANPEWSDNWQGDVYIIKLGKVLSRNFKK